MLEFSDAFLESYAGVDIPRLLKPVFDALWNAAVWVGSANYDEKGNWSDQRQGR